jgi:hypothetical protein
LNHCLAAWKFSINPEYPSSWKKDWMGVWSIMVTLFGFLVIYTVISIFIAIIEMMGV